MSAVTDSYASEDDISAQSVVDQPEGETGRLTIVTGTQQGATIVLRQGQPLSVGSSLGDDIVLRQTDVVPNHISVSLSNSQITIRCVSAPILVDGCALSQGESIAATDTASVELGSVGLVVHSSITPEPVLAKTSTDIPEDDTAVRFSDPEVSLVDASIFETDVADLPATTPQQGKGAILPDEKKLARNKSRLLPKLLVMTVLCLTAVGLWHSDLFKTQSHRPVVVLENLLKASPFAALSVVQNGNAATVSGYLQTFEESAELNAWLDKTQFMINNEVLVGEALGEQVVDLFRVNGVAAEVSVEEGGVVSVISKEADLSLLDSIKSRVMADIPNVSQLQIDNTPPPVAEEIKPVIEPDLDPGKRVVMVVSDALSYVVTEDQSRYFVGSLLPSGHRISSIDKGNVLLEKQGVKTKLEF